MTEDSCHLLHEFIVHYCQLWFYPFGIHVWIAVICKTFFKPFLNLPRMVATQHSKTIPSNPTEGADRSIYVCVTEVFLVRTLVLDVQVRCCTLFDFYKGWLQKYA